MAMTGLQFLRRSQAEGGDDMVGGARPRQTLSEGQPTTSTPPPGAGMVGGAPSQQPGGGGPSNILNPPDGLAPGAGAQQPGGGIVALPRQYNGVGIINLPQSYQAPHTYSSGDGEANSPGFDLLGDDTFLMSIAPAIDPLINDVYRTILGRDGSNSDFAHWRRIVAEMTRNGRMVHEIQGYLETEFRGSEEYKTRSQQAAAPPPTANTPAPGTPAPGSPNYGQPDPDPAQNDPRVVQNILRRRDQVAARRGRSSLRSDLSRARVLRGYPDYSDKTLNVRGAARNGFDIIGGIGSKFPAGTKRTVQNRSPVQFAE